MEKLGVADKDLLVELKEEYKAQKEKLAHSSGMDKTGAVVANIEARLEAIASQIDTIEKRV
jgi:hypothetical protein